MLPVATTSAQTMLQAWKRAWCRIHFFFAGVLPGSDCHVSVSGVRPWGVLPPARGSWGPCQGGPGYQVGHPPLHHQPAGPHQGPPGGWAAPLSGCLVWLSQVLMSVCLFAWCVFMCVEMAQLSSYDSGNPETPETDDSVDVSTQNIFHKIHHWVFSNRFE